MAQKKPHFSIFRIFSWKTTFWGRQFFEWWSLVSLEIGGTYVKNWKNQNIKGQHIFLMRAIDFPHKNCPRKLFSMKNSKNRKSTVFCAKNWKKSIEYKKIEKIKKILKRKKIGEIDWKHHSCVEWREHIIFDANLTPFHSIVLFFIKFTKIFL